MEMMVSLKAVWSGRKTRSDLNRQRRDRNESTSQRDQLRVLVLNHFAVPRGQAGGTRHVELFARLSAWQTIIIAGNRNPLTSQVQLPEPGFVPVRVLAHSSNGWRRVLGWVSYAVGAFLVGIRQRRIDVVYASSPHLLAATAGWAIAAVRRAPFVMEVRDLWPQVLVDMGQLSENSRIFRALRYLEIFLYSRANTIVIMAEGSRNAIEGLGIQPDKLVYIPNGADLDDFVPSTSRTILRQRLAFTRFTAVYAGAHGPANGLELLLDAAEDLQGEEIDIVLVGGGVAKDALVDSARTRGLENVRFLPPISKEEIPDLLHASDLGLHVLADVELFRTAVSPNKLFDYMAAGLPALTNCPGLVSDLVVAAQCGCAVEPERIANGLRQVAKLGPDQLQEMSKAGRMWIEQNQSRTAMAARLSEILVALVDD